MKQRLLTSHYNAQSKLTNCARESAHKQHFMSPRRAADTKRPIKVPCDIISLPLSFASANVDAQRRLYARVVQASPRVVQRQPANKLVKLFVLAQLSSARLGKIVSASETKRAPVNRCACAPVRTLLKQVGDKTSRRAM